MNFLKTTSARSRAVICCMTLILLIATVPGMAAWRAPETVVTDITGEWDLFPLGSAYLSPTSMLSLWGESNYGDGSIDTDDKYAIYAQHASGGSVSPASSLWASDPGHAIWWAEFAGNERGAGVLVWLDSEYAPPPLSPVLRVYAMRWNGVSWSSAEVLQQGANIDLVRSSVDEDGVAFITWSRDSEVFWSYFDSTTDQWKTTYAGPGTAPDIAAEADGHFTLMWSDANTVMHARGQYATLTAPEALSAPGGSHNPRVVHVEGHTVAAWLALDSQANLGVWAFHGSKGPDAARQISGDAPVDVDDLDIAVNKWGDAAVTWIDDNGTPAWSVDDGFVYLSRLSSDSSGGGTWSEPEQMFSGPGNVPRVVVNDARQVIVARNKWNGADTLLEMKQWNGGTWTTAGPAIGETAFWIEFGSNALTGETLMMWSGLDGANMTLSEARHIADYGLRAIVDGNGGIAAKGASVCGSDCTTYHERGTSVVLDATPDEGASFSHWAGCTAAAGSECTVELYSPRVVKAVFTGPEGKSSGGGGGGGAIDLALFGLLGALALARRRRA